MKRQAVGILISLLISAGAASAESIIVDNTTSAPHSFTTSGTWVNYTTPSGYYGSNYTAADSAVNSNSAARWRPSITTAGVYKIYMKWTEASVRPDRAPIDIYYDGGAKTDSTRRLNQQINGGVWVYIGSYFLKSGTNNSIRIKASDDGRVCADAVLFELSYATTNSPSDPALTTARAEYDGDYGKITRPTNAPLVIYYSGGTVTQLLNQATNSSQWVSLGAYNFASGTNGSVLLKASAVGIVAADAIKFELASNTNTFVIVDNDTAGAFSKNGTWTASISPTGFYGTNYVCNSGTNASASVRWRPNLPVTGSYTVYARWPDAIDLRDRPEEVQIVRTDAGGETGHVFELRLGGQPFEIKGSCGHEVVEEIAEAGGNTIRAYSASSVTPDFMRQASDAGIKVLLGLWLTPAEGTTSNFYDSATNVSNQFTNLVAQINTYKNYKSLLAWSIGNEIDPADVANPAPLYQAVQQVARYIREVDHYHPCLTAHAGAETNKISRVIKWAPDVDIIGVNSYYPHVYNVTSNMITAGWNGSCFITEYFLRQPMTMQNETNGLTSWGGVIEPVSGEKYTRLLDIYANAILPQADRCIGAFVFKGALGAAGFRVTHTWYPIMDDNLKPTPSYDAMRECWGGPAAPELTAPKVETIKLSGHYAWDSGFIITNATGTLTATVTVTAPTNAVLEYRVELRTNATIYTSYSPPVLTNNITITQSSNDVRTFYILNTGLPNGDYRLFYYVRRTDGAPVSNYVSVGTANFPFRKAAN